MFGKQSAIRGERIVDCCRERCFGCEPIVENVNGAGHLPGDQRREMAMRPRRAYDVTAAVQIQQHRAITRTTRETLRGNGAQFEDLDANVIRQAKTLERVDSRTQLPLGRRRGKRCGFHLRAQLLEFALRHILRFPFAC